MKIFISADIEGVACICSQTEIDLEQTQNAPFRKQMTAEVAAACLGAFDAGATQITIKDAHWTGRNIEPESLPQLEGIQLLRGWSGHPFGMVQSLDNSFDAVAFIGFHSAAGSANNPLAHTINGGKFSAVEINGEPASECIIYAFAAASVGVPLVFLSGDRSLCEESEQRIPGLVTVPVLDGFGASSLSVLPEVACDRIRRGLATALANTIAPINLPDEFHTQVQFNKTSDAYAKSFYPGARLESHRSVVFDSGDCLEMLTFLWFMAT